MDSQSSKGIPSSSFDEYTAQLQGSALSSTRHAAGLPRDLAFHRSIDQDLARDLDGLSSRVLSVANRLIHLASTADTTSGGGKGKGKLESQDDVMDSFHSLVVDSMDQMLERVDTCLDKYTGHLKPPAIAIKPPPPQKKQHTPKGRLDPAIQHASHLRKPQLDFTIKPNNMDTSPWYPTLKHKYNAQVPLGYDYHDDDEEATICHHPYRYEITHLHYPSYIYTANHPQRPSPSSFSTTPFTYVSTPSAFSTMLSSLLAAQEIAVDLEHNSYRSYAGFVCLMQISTREGGDWVIDCLVPSVRDMMGELGVVFSNPAIVKVLHGADSDIIWLQQDFNLYIVNLFDTYHASKVLEFPRHGLLNLLEMYCDFTPDKRYQLADWRIRPLPEEMLQYARSDTHFLLYIYDNLRNALLDKALSRPPTPPFPEVSCSPDSKLPNPSHTYLNRVLTYSSQTALRTYSKEVYDEDGGSGPGGWDTLAKKWNKASLVRDAESGEGKEIYKAVHKWRDNIAREDDESVRYVLQNHYLFQFAEKPPLDMAGLVGMFGNGGVPPVVRRRAGELFGVVSKALKNFEVARGVEMDAITDTPLVEESATREEIQAVDSTSTSSLWSHSRPGPSTTVASSSLFGSSLPSNSTSSALKPFTYSASKSSLFGNTGHSSASSDDQTFRDLVTRIHGTLTIAPKIVSGTVTESKSTKSDSPITIQATSTTSSGMIEIPYVPASQRQISTKSVDIMESDSVVVVGQARQKKRKRIKTASTQGSASVEDASESARAKKKAKSDEEVIEPFDYSTAPNILDDVPEQEQEVRKKKKGKSKGKIQKGGKIDYGNFPAPPKAHRELKTGNQSMTFR